MSGDEDREPRGPRVRRVDDRLGLAIARAGLSGRTLVTYARDHVLVRTPSRPGFRAGNTLDLQAPPAAADLPRWVERFEDTAGRLGARDVQLRWEEPGASTPEGPDAALTGAAGEHGLRPRAARALLLDELAEPAPVAADLVPVAPPSAVPGGPVDRRWHGASVLYRYDADAPGSEGWRDVDEEEVAWRVEVQRELATEERAVTWLAFRHGAPVGRVTLVHDRQGLAAVQDLVVHPVHRGAGVGAALAHRAVATHLALEPAARVGAIVAPGSPADRLARRLGFATHATVWILAPVGGRADAGWR